MWCNPNLELILIVYCILKFIFIISSLTLPLPNGIFAPMISFGAAFGRLFGHCLYLIGDYYGIKLVTCNIFIEYLNINLDEGIYAVVGATCVYGSVTKTVSIAIIMFEVTG